MNVYRLLASCGYIGFTPHAPGTVASLVVVVVLFFLPPLPWYVILGLLVGSIFISEKAADCEKDPSWIVVDELVGMSISVYGVPQELGVYAIAFLLFRFFDILKPYPINKLQDFSGGFGIIIDDVLAGVFALALTRAWMLFFG